MRLQLRRGISALWASRNPVLAPGEPGFDLTTGAMKVGDGVSTWAQLGSVNASATPTPSDTGLVAWSSDPTAVSTGQLAVAGTLYLSALYVRRPIVSGARTLQWGINTAGSGAVAGQCFAALISPDGVILGSTAIDARVAATGLFEESLGAFALPVGTYYGALLINATGMPQIYRGSSLNASLINTSLSATGAGLRFSTNGTGLTALPGSIVPSANASSGAIAYWMGVK